MSERSKLYNKRIAESLENPRVQEALHKFSDSYLDSRKTAFEGYDFEEMRSEISGIKDNVVKNWKSYIDEFTAKAEKAEATVYYARTAEDANVYIKELAAKSGVKKVVKSKSMASEEILLNRTLKDSGIDVIETDLGEWIVQLADQKPSHMVMPAIHMFRDEVAELFSKKTGKNEPLDIEHLVKVARKHLRKEYLEADMGISGANIAVAEIGGIVIVTNEGNARLVTTLPDIHVALVGIEKIVPKLDDAVKILRVLPKNATGQNITSYVTWIRGAVPSANSQKKLHIVLLDNGRSRLAESESCKSALKCIKCGACANVCPVYQTVGGHVFGHIYIGAIGIILTAFYHGLERAAEIVKACIGCRACVTVCPSKIDLENIILSLRETIGETDGIGKGKSIIFKRVLRNRKRFHSLLRAAKKLQKPVLDDDRVIRHLPLFFSGLTEWRTLPSIAERSLRDIFPKLEQQLDTPVATAAFYAGCLNDFVYPEIGKDLVKVLNSLNIKVVFPEEQNCCGVPALYSGDRETATVLAVQNLNAMLDSDADYVVTTCPTCTMALQRDFAELLKDDPVKFAKAEKLASITMDISKFVTKFIGDKRSLGNISDTVTYHDSCHLKRGAGVWKEPRMLLARTGRKIHEMKHSDRCCGFGGSYSFTSHANISSEILSDKLDDIEESGAKSVAMDCPGCLLQIHGGLDKRRSGIKAKHTIQLLAESLEE